jgi:hypothetical protein
MFFGRFEMYRLVEFSSPSALRRELNDSYVDLSMVISSRRGETNPSEAYFVAKLVETPNAELRVTNVEVLGKAKTKYASARKSTKVDVKATYPLQAPVEVSIIALDVSTFPKREA